MVPIALHGVLDPDDRHNKGPRPKRKAQNKNELEAQRPSCASRARRGAARRGNLLAGLVLAGELGLSISLSVKPAPLMAMTMDKSAVAAEVAAAVNMVRERWEALTQHGAQLATQLANRLIESSTLVLRLEQNIRELDMQCKRDVCKGLRQLTLAPEAFNASTHEHLTLYLAIWTEAPLAEMRKFRIAEVALLAEV
ncbi:Hypothetical Protein FCC1311_084182 [Hondaea fermentalgiana]|uniref:Uncharacterized protein n=1 Tax=Hondaea fermentalgiana TaxID=2315210 RepID=A0A2R5GU64_9STRA|nr:Hypothetical Protein FCC1311_084182 [Hondaea fermentalgiana]|eukprot:GBG32193.1 Hypothetical Protein FCC1311_084182 [Hondaea fermentalgiana]